MERRQNRAQRPHYGSVENLLEKRESVNKAEQREDGYIEPHMAHPENPWDYDFKYEYCNGVEQKYWNLDEEEDNIIRLLKYRIDAENEYDCDGSGPYGCDLARELYRKLWDWKDGGERKQTYGKVGDKGWLAGPETMNSFFIAFGCASKMPGRGKTDKRLYHQLVESQKQLNEFLRESERKDDTPWKEFSKYYHTLGNFTLVPAGFNPFRARQCGDFWDLSLLYLKQEMGNSWLNRDNIFTKYINYFFLWDYVKVDGIQYQVRSLHNCDFKNDMAEVLNGDESPSLTADETYQFLDNAMWAIKRRGIFMTAMLRLNKLVGDKKYAELRKKVFLTSKIYSGYDAVISRIGDLPSEVTADLEILQCL